jgi:hypothetical protein
VRLTAAFRWLVFLCLLLVTASATAQVAHLHADQLSGTAKHCPICPVLHSLTPLVYSVQLHFSFQTAAYLCSPEDAVHQLDSSSFALFSRPPPALV